MRGVLLGLLIIVVMSLALAACGDDEGGDDGDAATSISAELADFEFSPNSWTVAAGEEITIDLENAGSVEHEWVLMQAGAEISSEDELPETEEELLEDFVYWEDEVEPGESKTLTFTAPAAGDYQVICAIEGHFDAGMEGSLTAQ